MSAAFNVTLPVQLIIHCIAHLLEDWKLDGAVLATTMNDKQETRSYQSEKSSHDAHIPEKNKTFNLGQIITTTNESNVSHLHCVHVLRLMVSNSRR